MSTRADRGGSRPSPASRGVAGSRSTGRLPRAVLLNVNDGGLTLARELRRHGVEVHALVVPGTEWLTAGRVMHAHRVPALPGGAGGWLAVLRGLGDRPGVLIPTSDAACELVCRRREEIPATLASFESATSGHLELMDKERLYEVAAEAGVLAPWVRVAADRAALERLAAEVQFPCILKGAMGHDARRAGGHATRRVDSPAELLTLGRLALDDGHRLLVTALVPGDESRLEGAVTIRDCAGEYALSYGRRKLRQYPPDYGGVSLMVAEPAPGTVAMARTLLDHVGFHGVSSLEAKRHEASGELMLIEVNVRLPQSWGLSRANRSDGSWRLYGVLAGLPLDPPPEPRAGVKVLLPQLDLLTLAEHRRAGRLDAGEVACSLRGVRDWGAFSWRHPAPALAFLRREAHVRWRRRRER
jgi:predicted ATP-grasp superfamily ATP-dependent carboligase